MPPKIIKKPINAINTNNAQKPHINQSHEKINHDKIIKDNPQSNNINQNNIMELHVNKMDDIDIKTFSYEKEIGKLYNFKTDMSKIIKSEVILFALKNINRTDGIFKLANYVPFQIAVNIEEGVFEFTLCSISNEKTDMCHFSVNMYNDKINSLCKNLDQNDTRIDNKTLYPLLLDGSIDGYLLPFMSPHQIHPQRWKKELDRRQRKEEAKNKTETTGMYKCSKCGARESITHQTQMRSADEPMTIIVTCMKCYKTFKTQ